MARARGGPTLRAHEKRRHLWHGPVPAPHVVTNAELVEHLQRLRRPAERASNAQRIAAGEMPALVHSSVEFIEKASGIKQRYVIDKSGVLDPTRMKPRFAERPDEELSLMAEIRRRRQAGAGCGRAAGRRHRRRAVRRRQHAARLPGHGLRDPAGHWRAAAMALT
jgi:hypothetical protein